MKNKRKSESKKKKFEEFLQNSSCEVTLKSYDLKTLNDKIIKSDTSFISSDLGLDLLFDFSKIIKNEALSELAIFDEHLEEANDIILTILYRKFNLTDFKNGTVQDAIVEYIKNLNLDQFIISFEEIREKILSLRKEKVNFWELLFLEYKKRQNFFDRELIDRFERRQKQVTTARRHGSKLLNK